MMLILDCNIGTKNGLQHGYVSVPVMFCDLSVYKCDRF